MHRQVLVDNRKTIMQKPSTTNLTIFIIENDSIGNWLAGRPLDPDRHAVQDVFGAVRFGGQVA
jgi:hypothetical protein